MKRLVLIASVLAATLTANSRLAFSSLAADWPSVTHGVSAELHQDYSEVWFTTAAECFDAPSKPSWNLGGHKSAQKFQNQLQKRGWTPQQIDEALSTGQNFSAPNLVNPGNGATRYVHLKTGRSVVIDNTTNEVLHVGGDGFKY